jgi:uncharacterized protein (DUF2062 family)
MPDGVREVVTLALFRRRQRRGLWNRIIETVWPSQGFRRSIHYIAHRVKRLPASPHAIAAGFASGAAVSFLPAIGLHFLLGFALAWLVRGNMIAAALGTAVGNPLTFPLFFSAAYRLGRHMMGAGQLPTPDHLDFDVIAEGEALMAQGVDTSTLSQLLPMLKVTAVGAVPISIVAFAVFYFVVLKLAARFQAARGHRLAARFRPLPQG